MLKRAFPVRSRTPQAKERSQHLRLATDSSKLRCCGCKLATVSLSRSPAPGLSPSPPQREGSGSHTTPASPAPSWLTRRAQPHMARLPVPGRAGLPRAPGAIFLERLRAPPGRALLTCVFFIRKGSAAIQPRQRCGDSV